MDRRDRQKINAANAERQGRTSFWTEARVAVLRAMAAEKLSTSVIARAIGDGCTRNMVIGKARRLGIKLGPPYAHDPVKMEQRRQRNIDRRIATLRNRCAHMIGQIIELSRKKEIRVSCETNGRAA